MQTSLCEECNTYVIWSQREGLCAWCLWERGKYGQKVIDITLCPRDCQKKTAERKSMNNDLCTLCNIFPANFALCNFCLNMMHAQLNRKESMECSGVMRVAHCNGCKKGQMPWKDSGFERPVSSKMVLIAETERTYPILGSFDYMVQPNNEFSKFRVFTSLHDSKAIFIEEPDIKYHWIYRDDLKAE